MTPDRVAALIRAGTSRRRRAGANPTTTRISRRASSSAEFAGKRPIARHQLVYQTLGALMGREIHALSIEALTPEEAAGK